MTQLSSIGPSQPFEAAASSRLGTTASGLVGRFVSTIVKPDVLVVLAICAIGLVLTLVAASQLASFSDAITEIYLTP